MTDLVGTTNLPTPDPLGRFESGSITARTLLLLAFLAMFYLSLAIISRVATNFHVNIDPTLEGLVPLAWIVPLAALLGSAFIFARFSFGYLIGFHLFAMMAGYFWLNAFGTLGYDRPAALASAVASIILFLLPALLITRPLPRPFVLSHAALDILPVAILCLGAVVFVVGAFGEFHFVGIGDIYKYRDTLNHARPFWYFAGMFNGALFPFAFACFFARRRWLMLALLCGVVLLSYPTTLTKVSLFVPFFLIFVAVLCSTFEARAAVILCLLIPAVVGSLASMLQREIAGAVFGFVSLRMLAIPSIALEHHYVFFSDHPLTWFCQVSLLQPLMSCPYSDQLGDVMSKWFGLGSMNASLFAIEGVASVGPLLAPVSALGCGLVIALGNRLSAGLPAPFILLSAAGMPHILLNVSLSTTLVTHGLIALYLLWAVTPRDYFEARWHASAPQGPATG